MSASAVSVYFAAPADLAEDRAGLGAKSPILVEPLSSMSRGRWASGTQELSTSLVFPCRRLGCKLAFCSYITLHSHLHSMGNEGVFLGQVKLLTSVVGSLFRCE